MRPLSENPHSRQLSTDYVRALPTQTFCPTTDPQLGRLGEGQADLKKREEKTEQRGKIMHSQRRATALTFEMHISEEKQKIPPERTDVEDGRTSREWPPSDFNGIGTCRAGGRR